jgi:protein-tyrosine-phosphatase
MLSTERALAVWQALADPNRLRLFELLLQSDQTNSELGEATGLRQNLLSHHLTVLLDCELIRAHQSKGDARRHYFSVNLHTARGLLRWWDHRSPLERSPLPALKRPRRVLFLCLHNTSRSVMAESLARYLAPNALLPFSAGLKATTEPPLLPVARQVLEEHGLVTEGRVTKTYDDAIAGITIDYVIAVCDIVHEAMLPPALTQAEYLHWSLCDPLEGETETEQLLIAYELYAELERRIAFFVRRLADEDVPAEHD